MVGNLIEVKNYLGEGYRPLVSFGAWRVAVLRYTDELHPDNLKSMERHSATEEVFVLTHGRAMLVLGGNGPAAGEISTVAMNTGEVYNVKINTWHTIVISQDASVLIIENDDTSKENSEYCMLGGDLQAAILKHARAFLALL